MRFSAKGEGVHDANAGLKVAIDLLKPIKANYPNISNADLWSLAAVVAVKEMGGPTIDWNSGRIDALTHHQSAPDGRLPDATKGCPHLREVFNRMEFNDQEIVALSGAHSVGSCHGDRSGFVGPWTSDPHKFDNEYFVNLLKCDWYETE
jgi:catalase (peroxidase I)